MTIRTAAFRGAGRVAAVALAVAALTCVGGRALAQTEEDAATHVVVQTDGAVLRSGAGLDWYAVRDLEQDTVLRVREEIEGWLKVEYPQGTPAVVRIAEAELAEEDDDVVVLTRRSALVAFNMEDPSTWYKRIFVDRQLPPGTRLTYLGPLEDRRGELAGYKVIAPAGAVGYVLPGDTRPATHDEIRAFEGRTPDEEPQPAQETTPGEADDAGEQTPPAAEREEEAQKEPAAESPEPADEPEVDAVRPETPQRPAPRERRAPAADSLEDLDAAYARVMEQDLETAEFGTLIAEYRAYRDALPDTEAAQVEREYVDARIELLRLRAAVQERVRALAALEADAANAEETLDQLVEGIQAARGYAVVGRLAPSIIYDGRRLPRMYRVTSVDAASGGRTLAYVLPEDGLGLVGKLGAIVGVMGEDDPGARRGEVRVIRPTRVEVLETE